MNNAFTVSHSFFSDNLIKRPGRVFHECTAFPRTTASALCVTGKNPDIAKTFCRLNLLKAGDCRNSIPENPVPAAETLSVLV